MDRSFASGSSPKFKISYPRRGCPTLPMTVSCGVSASHSYGGDTIMSVRDVLYVIEERGDKQSMLDVNHRIPVTFRKAGAPSSETLPLPVTSTVSKMMIPEMAYDLRAIFYAFGRFTAMHLAHVELPYDTCQVNFFESSATAASDRDIVFTTVPGHGRSVTYLLALAAADCGKGQIFMANKSGRVGARPATWSDMGNELYFAIRFLFTDAASTESFGAHVVAFLRGMCCAWTMRSHSDEGGWARRFLRRATYPEPCGTITSIPNSSHFSGLFEAPGRANQDLHRVATSIFITGFASIQDGDFSGHLGIATMLPHVASLPQDELYPNPLALGSGGRSGLSTGLGAGPSAGSYAGSRPSNFPGLRKVATRILEHMGWCFSATYLGMAKPGGFQVLPDYIDRYFDEDLADCHFDRAEIFPFCVVEHGPVITTPKSRFGGPQAGRIVELELVPGNSVLVPDSSPADMLPNGRYFNKNVYINLRATTARNIGLVYLCNEQWRGATTAASKGLYAISGDGNTDPLADVSYARRPARGEATLNSITWFRKDCPVPGPSECTFSQDKFTTFVGHSRGSVVDGLRLTPDSLAQPVLLQCSQPLIYEGVLDPAQLADEDGNSISMSRTPSPEMLKTLGRQTEDNFTDERTRMLAIVAGMNNAISAQARVAAQAVTEASLSQDAAEEPDYSEADTTAPRREVTADYSPNNPRQGFDRGETQAPSAEPDHIETPAEEDPGAGDV